ncbi:MAG: MurR/RpiR family transcriptional regulator [Methylobacterium mesophilicum]|nr:MurR/RpiR family transcriptional regulator [Methylobacterium mesophilicum]
MTSAALPRDFDSFRARVIAQREALPRRLAQIAAYALDNPDEIAFGTAASIAASAGVQPSTLVRFSQHLGYDGFSSLQTVFRERLRGQGASYKERLQSLDAAHQGSPRALLDGFADAAARSLDTLARGVSDTQLERAVDILAQAETVFIMARRRSYPVASYLAYALGKLEIRNQLVDSSAGLDPEIMGFAGPKDALVAISFAPYVPATVERARDAVARGVPVVAITDSAFSPLAQTASVWFEVAEADFAGFRSLSASMALAMTLAVAVGERRRST